MMNSQLYNTYQQNQQIIVTSFQPEKQNFIREIRNYAIYQVFGIWKLQGVLSTETVSACFHLTSGGHQQHVSPDFAAI